ncbi:uncharacterized protein J3D65DRAFT_642924, partial [Phyllosticta citribraziliensis]
MIGRGDFKFLAQFVVVLLDVLVLLLVLLLLIHALHEHFHHFFDLLILLKLLLILLSSCSIFLKLARSCSSSSFLRLVRKPFAMAAACSKSSPSFSKSVL